MTAIIDEDFYPAAIMVVIPVLAAAGHDDNKEEEEEIQQRQHQQQQHHKHQQHQAVHDDRSGVEETAGSSRQNVEDDDVAEAAATTFVGEKEKEMEEGVIVTEDDWGLAMDFHLFAQHEEYLIPLPSRRRQRSTTTRANDNNKKNDNDDNKDDEQTIRMASSSSLLSLRLRCVESLTPLDMAQLGGGDEEDGVDGDATGHCVWTAAFFLLRFIYDLQDDFSCFTNRRVLELGCGTGLAGLAVTMLTQPAHMTLTDRDPHVLALCQTNIQLNRDAIILASATAAAALDGYSGEASTISVRSLTWGQEGLDDEVEEEEYGCFDTVLATDVLYDIALLPKLFQSAHHALGCHCRDRSSSTTCRRRHHRRDNNDDDAEETHNDDDHHRRYYFVLSHVPRACYKSTDQHPPPVADLDRYICDRALEYGLELARVYRPTLLHDDDIDTEQQETTTAFATKSSSSTPPRQRKRLGDCRSMREMAEIGAAIFVFAKM
jgi:predicted nicotinamide N-methyase